jgi:phosphotransferase system IIB component
VCYYTLMNVIVVLQRDFFLENVYWLAGLGALALVVLFFLVDHFVSAYQLKKEAKMRTDKVYIKALGGEGNVLGKSLEGSRIIVSLKDYDLVDKDKLRDYGVSGFVKMSDHLVMVIKKDPQGVYEKLFSSRP